MNRSDSVAPITQYYHLPHYKLIKIYSYNYQMMIIGRSQCVQHSANDGSKKAAFIFHTQTLHTFIHFFCTDHFT